MEKKLQDICNYLIEKTKAPLEDGKTDFGSTMTNLRLQKMLYFVYGIYYANSKKELFTPNFEAWDYGPVEIDAYKNYSVYTSDYIPLPKVEISVDDTLLDKTITLINKYSTFALVDMSHATTPYINAINRDKKISAGEIKSYFIKNNPFKHDK